MQHSNAGVGVIALLNFNNTTHDVLKGALLGNHKLVQFNSIYDMVKDYERLKLNVVAVIAESEVMGASGVTLAEILSKKGLSHIPFFLLSHKLDNNLAMIAMQGGVADVFLMPLNLPQIETRVNFLIQYWRTIQKKETDNKHTPAYKTPFLKRSFDIVFSGMALIFLSPLILLVIIIMKLESRGPVFYYSYRVGTGYRVFKFYKFRSMFVDADKRLKDLKHLNQYSSGEKAAEESNIVYLCDECAATGVTCRSMIYADNIKWCEKQYLDSKKQQGDAAFFKLKNDPRITKVGRFIRNYSIDELPQLWNVVIGDMSIVGNRPLPLYEAEKLTTDKYASRFLAPAGMTGLWQVEKRGKGEMSEDERLLLDNTYAESHSFWYDIGLIFKTIPALFQKENV
ncbi:MAG: sugar transferase [Flavipsychrobacter sp.]|nr:sugar transferase [Flavipsychrobacter sp.]